MQVFLFLIFIASASSFPAPDTLPSLSRKQRSADELGDLARWDPVTASSSFKYKASWSTSSKNSKPSIKISTSFSNKTHRFSQVLDGFDSIRLLESLTGPIENQFSQVLDFMSEDIEHLTAKLSSTGFDTSTPKLVKKIAALGEEYLGRFGYMSKTKANRAKIGGLIDAKSFKRSIKDFQRMAGVEPTGELNKETMKMMSKSRCGVEDTMGAFTMGIEVNEADSKFRSKKQQRKRNKRKKARRDKKRERHGRSRSKRYNLEGSRWSKTDLKYIIKNYTPDLSESQTRDAIQRAFDVWANQTPLTFTRTNDLNAADLQIEFGRRSHGDPYPFDGKGGTLAHAFFPSDGRAHFDDDEDFTYKENRGVNLFIVAAHEFGHSLGLAHSSVSNSLMAPFYQGYVRDFELHPDDIAAIQQLYGKEIKVDERKRKPKPTKTPTRPTKPKKPTTKPRVAAMNVCGKNISFDTMFYDHRRKCTYAFKGTYYWKLTDYGVADDYPRKIGRYWNGLPGNLNAAAYLFPSGNTFFFKGSRVWKYSKNRVLLDGYPRDVSYFNLPPSPHAAMQWRRDGMIYLFKGKNFYRFSEYGRSTDVLGRNDHTKISKYWNGVPNAPDAAIQWKNGDTYVFKNNDYYKVSNLEFKVANNYPKSVRKFWVGCGKKMNTQSKLTKKGKKPKGSGKKKGRKTISNTRVKLARLQLAPSAPR